MLDFKKLETGVATFQLQQLTQYVRSFKATQTRAELQRFGASFTNNESFLVLRDEVQEASSVHVVHVVLAVLAVLTSSSH